MNATRELRWMLLAVVLTCRPLSGAPANEPTPLPLVTGVPAQPLVAQMKRLTEALEFLGSPLSAAERKRLEAAAGKDDGDPAREIQEVLDPHCLVGVDINPEMRVKAAQGPAAPELVEQGWRTFLVKVRNQSGSTASLRAISPHARSVHDSPWQQTESDKFYSKQRPSEGRLPTSQAWLDLDMFDKQPLKRSSAGCHSSIACSHFIRETPVNVKASSRSTSGRGRRILVSAARWISFFTARLPMN